MMRAGLEIDADALARPRGDLPLDFDDERLARGERDIEKRLAAEMLGDLHLAGEHSLVRRRRSADAPAGCRPSPSPLRAASRRRPAALSSSPDLPRNSHLAVPAPADLAGDEIHPRRADEAGDEEVGGMVVEIERRADLLDHAGAQHDDAVGERHRLDLVVGDEDHGRAELPVQLA